MHWVYIIRCDNNVIYVGETKRLYRRLNEHCNKDSGSVTTHDCYPQSLIGLYKVEDECSILNDYNWDFEDEKMLALSLENTIAEMYMQAMGPKWENVYGGKYHVGYRPENNPGKNLTFNRPYCNCKIPAHLKNYNGKTYWRCAKKNIWDKLEDYVLNTLDFSYQKDPCDFYKDYESNVKFTCENLIYKYPINIGTCQLLSDSEDD